MSFEDIKGQDSAITFLKSSIRKNRIAQGYLFAGPEGVGKKMAAVTFAKALNCALFPQGAPCGECVSCRKISSSNHPDVFIVTGEKEGSNIGIDRIRELIRDVSLKPYEGRKKVFIIDNAEALKHEAANAILKTLEEPPKDSVLILIAQDAMDIFPTIRSRCQTVKFYPIGDQYVKDTLIRDHKVSPSDAEVIKRFAYGRLGYAARLARGDFLRFRRPFISQLISGNIIDGELDGASRADIKLRLDLMLTLYRDLMITRELGSTGELINCDMADDISRLARDADPKYLDGLLKQIIMTNSYIDANANPKLALAALGLAL